MFMLLSCIALKPNPKTLPTTGPEHPNWQAEAAYHTAKQQRCKTTKGYLSDNTLAEQQSSKQMHAHDDWATITLVCIPPLQLDDAGADGWPSTLSVSLLCNLSETSLYTLQIRWVACQPFPAAPLKVQKAM